MIKPIELVIFDCDGVLVDSERIAVRIQIALGAELGWPLSQADVIDRFIGRSRESICEQIAQRLGDETAAFWWKQLIQRHREEVDAGLQAVDGLPEALAEITLPVCVASSGSHEKMRHTLGVTELYERFAGHIFSSTEVSRGKPAPDLFLHAARQMGVDPAACAVVEDSRPGVQAARAAGMRAFGYAGGLTQAERLEGPGTIVFHDMRKLPHLIGDQ
ncbi:MULTISPECIES: HAD family hydrolase [unclassified Streptomyces]|uniref:HAD family hydrolase n=1 Tax=unclassified Streptomyces TaxID=2593676 RepID=UPI002E2C8532|nr:MULTISPECIES: HAD family hydrolase [unclassified Streptomyces]